LKNNKLKILSTLLFICVTSFTNNYCTKNKKNLREQKVIVIEEKTKTPFLEEETRKINAETVSEIIREILLPEPKEPKINRYEAGECQSCGRKFNTLPKWVPIYRLKCHKKIYVCINCIKKYGSYCAHCKRHSKVKPPSIDL